MNDSGLKEMFATISSGALLEALMIVLIAACLTLIVQKLLPKIAVKLGGKPRFYLLASVPLLRLVIIAGAIVLVVPALIEPSFENMVAIFGALGLVVGFAFKDYGTSLIAGIVTLYEMPYRPGDWIEVDGNYGEVRSIGMRSAELVTPDDTVLVIPHSKLWESVIANANDGTDNLMCVAEFNLEPHHDVCRVMTLLRDVAYTSPHTRTFRPVVVVVSNTSWGMCYRLKAYPVEVKNQFRFISELTARGARALADEGVNFVSAPVTGGH
ncbi:mechanosensitive ion channel family protein [Marinobacter sp. F3R08]|uniref:mechanosensitive ion channel family protein n=1 Tax=Marinobacter sp. F3R08 TaxID=2841559 RepID=UPI001C08CA42|nr:mechanosensitive ion channel domain-containing protein [Marinobacter sp. F3R08]MBU2953902.1 mechanosensitive ion channel family protein [Marinobacter sp. F3R08]